MSSLTRIFGLAILGLALLVSVGPSQDKKVGEKDKKKEEKKKDTLPQFFSKLELSDDQKAKITDVQNTYKPKTGELGKQIGELNKKLTEVKKAETSDIFKVLTDDQKKKYDELVVLSKKKKEPEKKDKAPEKDKKTDKK